VNSDPPIVIDGVTNNIQILFIIIFI